MPDQKPTLEYMRVLPKPKRNAAEEADSVFELLGLLCFVVLAASLGIAVMAILILGIFYP